MSNETTKKVLGLTQREIELLIMSLPRDGDGKPINPASEYITKDGTPCRARIIVYFDVIVTQGNSWKTTVTQGNIWRTCTTADVVLRHKEDAQ